MSEKTLVIVHVFYPQLWKQLADCLSNLDKLNKTYDLYVTIPESLSAFSNQIYSFNKNAKIILTENLGYDIWPFIRVLNQIDLSSYDYLIKLHTKRSMGGTVVSISNRYYFLGRAWRNFLISFISKKSNLEKSLLSFEKDPSLGMVNSLYIKDKTHIDCNDNHFAFCANNAIKIINRIIPFNTKIIEYIAGSMFICRAKILEPLKELKFTARDFSSAVRGEENDLPHVLERVFGGLVIAQGYKISDPYTSFIDIILFYPYSLFCRFLSIKIVKKIIRFIFRIDGFYNEERVIRIFKIKLFTIKKK